MLPALHARVLQAPPEGAKGEETDLREHALDADSADPKREATETKSAPAGNPGGGGVSSSSAAVAPGAARPEEPEGDGPDAEKPEDAGDASGDAGKARDAGVAEDDGEGARGPEVARVVD